MCLFGMVIKNRLQSIRDGFYGIVCLLFLQRCRVLEERHHCALLNRDLNSSKGSG